MLSFVFVVLTAAPPLPKECEPPPVREVAPIKELTNLDGAFSAGLDAVATWCFESSGQWNGGVLAKAGKKGVGPRLPAADVPAQGDCLKAITSCESTFETVKNKAPLRELAANALADFDRPYRGQKYTPKRSGLKETPSDAANCRSRSRVELFQMAQQRMDLARLESQVLNEYANYKTWLYARGLECRNEIAAGPKKDPTRVGVSVDANPVPVAAPATKDPELAAALKLPMLDKWKSFAKLQSKIEGDRDFTLGFLASKELRGCDCTRVNPAAVVRALEKKEGGEAGIALLTTDDPANTKCAICMFEVFPLWSARAQKQCSTVGALSDADLAKLEKSDDASGLPPRCLEETKTTRAALKAAAEAKAAADAQAASAAIPAGRDGGALIAMTTLPGATGLPAKGTPVGNAPTATGSGGSGGSGGSAVRPATGGTGPVAATGATGTTTAGTTTTGTTGPTGTTSPTGTTGTVAATGGPGTGGGTGTTNAHPSLETVDGYTYYRPQPVQPNPVKPATGGSGGGSAVAAAAPGTGGSGGAKAGVSAPPPAAPIGATPSTGGGLLGFGGGPGTPTGPGVAGGFAPPTDWAPIPQREDGRIYVRLFMSSACIADVEPGPLQARTGDLLLLPFEAHALQVKSPCGGLAEVYFGREARPRVSENFGRNTPLKFEFKRQ